MAGTTSTSIKLFVIGLLVATLYMSAQKSREALGEHNLSRRGTLSWSWTDCLDLGTGSLACAAKQSVKIYTFNIRGAYVEKARGRAYEIAWNKAITDGLAINAAKEKATKSGKEAGRLASRKHKRLTGPVIAGLWDFFEVLYEGGTVVEGVMKGTGSLAGTYVGGVLGEQRMGRISSRVGYLVGSQIGSWLGGEVGLMVYDVCNGARLLTLSVGGFFGGTTENMETSETLETTEPTDSTDADFVDIRAEYEYQ